MAKLPARTEDPALHNTMFCNRTEDHKPIVDIFLSPKGEMVIETTPGKSIFLTPDQAAELFMFFDGERVKARMFDVLKRKLWKQGGAARAILKKLDRIDWQAVHERQAAQ
jgi:hypothetical protein